MDMKTARLVGAMLMVAGAGGCGSDGAGGGDSETTASGTGGSSTADDGVLEGSGSVASTGMGPGGSGEGPPGDTGDSTAAPGDTGDSTGAPSDTGDTGDTPLSFLAVTFNTGGHADGEADTADEWYGNGLSWIPAVEQTTAFLAELQPDVIVFQELFHSPDCQDIPPEFHAGYVCETWQPGDPTVVQTILGDGYQIACNLGKTDKCAAVKTSFGSIAGCDADLCLDGLDGAQVPDCGGGSRVGRGTIDLVGGGALTIVNFHGTSGFLPADQLCRVAQVDQVFVDLDGEPAVNGDMNLVLGDFNTDPARAALLDFSAQRWNDFVGDDLPFHFITAVGANVQPTYAGTLNIDHQVSDTFVGDCWHPGITAGRDPVVDFDYFDHVPAVCSLTVR